MVKLLLLFLFVILSQSTILVRAFFLLWRRTKKLKAFFYFTVVALGSFNINFYVKTFIECFKTYINPIFCFCLLMLFNMQKNKKKEISKRLFFKEQKRNDFETCFVSQHSIKNLFEWIIKKLSTNKKEWSLT